MKQESAFVISEFTNPSGQIVFRVSGWLDGKRIRKNFPTRAEAKAEADTLEIQRLQGETGVRPTVTRLTEDQLHEAESVFKRLSGKARSLSFHVDFALANYRESAGEKKIVDAIADYVALKQHEQEQDLISEPYVVRLRREMNRLPKRCPALTLAELTPARLTAYFEFGGATRKTYNNRRGIISGFLKFALQREWIAENPLVKIPAHRIRRRRTGAQTLAIDQAQELMVFVETNYPALRRSSTLIGHPCDPRIGDHQDLMRVPARPFTSLRRIARHLQTLCANPTGLHFRTPMARRNILPHQTMVHRRRLRTSSAGLIAGS